MIRLLDCGVECTYTNNCITLTNMEHDRIDIINIKILDRIKKIVITKEDFLSIVNDADKYSIFK